MDFNDEQERLINQQYEETGLLSPQNLKAIINPAFQINNLNDDELAVFCKLANAIYRTGSPIVTDQTYDRFLTELARRLPESDFLKSIEAEPLSAGERVKLPQTMLSTKKVYSFDDLESWKNNIFNAADNLNINTESLVFKMTPKLDGFACLKYDNAYFTRGDGQYGKSITHAFDRGLKVEEDFTGNGAGEIVCSLSYFNQHLAEEYDHARNFQNSVIKAKSLNESTEEAVRQGAVYFYPFELLKSLNLIWSELEVDFDIKIKQVKGLVDCLVDGVVIEVTDPVIKESMGANNRYHRWQVAYKINDEAVPVEVIRVIAQTAKSGKVVPVLELEPTYISGAMISRVTAHSFKKVLNQKLGKGSVIGLVRSGEVIPAIVSILSPAEKAEIPSVCPSCGNELVWEEKDGENLMCDNHANCPAQSIYSITFFFQTLGTCNGFGEATVNKLFEHAGVRNIMDIYQLKSDDYVHAGFSEKRAISLMKQLERSLIEPTSDFTLIGALALSQFGRSRSEKVFQLYPISQLLELTEEDLIKVEGVAKITATTITKGLHNIKDILNGLLALNFNLQYTPLLSEIKSNSNNPLSGMTVVFTGKMTSGSRSELEAHAKTLNIKPAKSVTGKCSYLICGENVGKSKLKAASDKGVKVLKEIEYLELIGLK